MIEERLVKSVINGKEVEYFEKFRCEYGNEVEDIKLKEENLNKAYDQYKRQEGLLTSKQIKNIRTVLGLSQNQFCEVLGLGRGQINRFENSAIQSLVIDRAIRNFYKANMIDENLKFLSRMIDEMYSWEFNYHMASKFSELIDKYIEFKEKGLV